MRPIAETTVRLHLASRTFLKNGSPIPSIDDLVLERMMNPPRRPIVTGAISSRYNLRIHRHKTAQPIYMRLLARKYARSRSGIT
jgi:hypothetical protein